MAIWEKEQLTCAVEGESRNVIAVEHAGAAAIDELE
ncbi:hypothetical protein PI125_g11409 [Phytophthora idaei]|nr:hypothetical protein PI125_g11409 [Phytophthora idaei]